MLASAGFTGTAGATSGTRTFVMVWGSIGSDTHSSSCKHTKLVPQSCADELHIEAPTPLADATLSWLCLMMKIL